MNNFIEIVSPIEALNRGNLFDNYFWPYKYVADLRPINEKEDLMNKIQMYCFAAHELNLYLDINPNNKELIGLFNQYEEEANNYIEIYEKKYGPLSVGLDKNLDWKWINSPWPWEGI